MNGTREIGQSDTYEDDGGLDHREAARLLARTQRQAQRGLDFRSPWLSQLAAAVALIVLGVFWAARSAVQEDWSGLGLSVAIVLVAAGSAFAGPRGVWLSDGVGCCVVLLGYSAVQAWVLRPSRSDA
jgi:hypothetical protein